MTRAPVALLAGTLLSCSLLSCTTVQASDPDPAASQAPEGFWEHWGDGQAELAGYALTQSRYGQLRSGEAVLVTVTETFTDAQRLKSDGGHRDEYPVIKLNEVRDFQTGIYDYNIMTSSFLALDGRLPRGVPTKLSMSMQEWCGHAWDQLLFDPTDQGLTARRTAHSYFDGEGDISAAVSLPDAVVAEDALPLLLRGLTGQLVPPGQAVAVQVLPRLSDLRMQHRELSFDSATITRVAGQQDITVPAGTFAVEQWTVAVGDVTTTYRVGVEQPHPLVSWSRSDGEEAVLTGLVRGTYWSQNGEGQEVGRAQLGLPARPWPGAAQAPYRCSVA